MFNDSFKSRYTTIPFATFARRGTTPCPETVVEPFPHNHREIELLAITDGTAQFNINSQSYHVEKGDIIVVSPYILHYATIFKSKNFSHFCLCFDLDLIADKELKLGLENGMMSILPIIKNSDKTASVLSTYIKNAFGAHARQKNGWELDVIGNLCLFFSRLKENGFIFKSVDCRQENSFCYRIMEYIGKNYALPVTSADAAKEFFMSSSYFCRMFKANFGYPFQNYLCMYRTEKAKILLESTDLSISEIASAVGFNSFSYFSKMFRELTGTTPYEYRKNI